MDSNDLKISQDITNIAFKTKKLQNVRFSDFGRLT